MYIMNRKWLKNWKEYVHYSYFKRKNQHSLVFKNFNQKADFTPDESKNPGPIDNSLILVPLSEFLNDGDISEPCNLVIRQDLTQREDIKIVSKQIWEFFFSKYGGGPVIIKPWIKEGFKKIVELYYRKVNIIILPDKKSLKTFSIHSLKTHVMYVSRTNKIKDLKSRYWKIYEKKFLVKKKPILNGGTDLVGNSEQIQEQNQEQNIQEKTVENNQEQNNQEKTVENNQEQNNQEQNNEEKTVENNEEQKNQEQIQEKTVENNQEMSENVPEKIADNVIDLENIPEKISEKNSEKISEKNSKKNSSKIIDLVNIIDLENLENSTQPDNSRQPRVKFPSNTDTDAFKFRLWKIDSNSSIADLKKFLINNITENGIGTGTGIGINPSNTNTLLNPESILEYLEYIPDIDLNNLELADTDICIVEHYTSDSDKLFRVKEIKIKEGKCDKCSKSTILKFFCACAEASYCSHSCKEHDYWHNRRCRKYNEIQEESLKANQNSKFGLVGLQNLGNTCFMNTSLQCMSNCKELTQYFLNNFFIRHINGDNPIGTQGVLARAYSNLLKNLHLGQLSVYSPWNFKSAISNFQSMFSGYQQHDTQEFLNYLLDGLHEDLNKVLKKPLVEKDESQKEDKIKAREQWTGFLRRNQSVLVDLLYGQYKSTLFCPSCANVSTTFDPFLSLSLPLFSKGEKFEITCFFIPYDIRIKPIQIDLNFYFDTSVMALRNKIARLLDIHPFSFIVKKMDLHGDIDFFPNSSMFIKNLAHQNLHKNQQSFFLFQIDPNIFYSKDNNRVTDLNLNQLRDFSNLYETLNKKKEEKSALWQEDYEEDQTGTTSESVCYYSHVNKENGNSGSNQNNNHNNNSLNVMKVNIDDNNCLNDDWIKLVINMKRYEDTYQLRKKLIFPRVVYVNKKWTLKYLHKFILNYFSKTIKDFTKLENTSMNSNISLEELWETYFLDLEKTLANNITRQFSQKEHKKLAYPYLIRTKCVIDDSNQECVFCSRISCKDCLLPCTDKETIQDYLNKIPKNNNFLIDNTFYYLSDMQRKAHGIKNRDFGLDITWLDHYIESVRKLNERDCFEIEVRKANRADSIDIMNCFRNFVKIEKLEEDNEWFCSKCKQHQRADKKLEIYRSPHIFIIHLKRFRNKSKIDNLVEFPVNGLDISNYVICKDEGLPLTYDLFAIANHYGGLGGGHYVSYAKNHHSGSWYSFNDSSVSRLNEDQLVSSAAYVLFYRRRDLENYIDLNEVYTKPFEDFESSSNNNSSNNSSNNFNIAQIEKLKIHTPSK